MAAPMNMLSSRILMQYIKVCQFRIFDRGLKRQPKKALSKEKEVNILRRKKIGLDPRKNPYVPFEAKDPVQKNLVELANSKGNTMTAKVIDQKLLRKDQGVNYRNKKSGTKMEVMSSASGAYTKLADSDKQFGQAVIRATLKKQREKSQEILLEGQHLILSALQAGVRMKELYFSGSSVLDDFPVEAISGIPVYKITYRQMKQWSDINTPEGLIGIFEMPEVDKEVERDFLPMTVIMDSVRDAATFGTLMRTAVAVGCQQVIAVKGCVDVWNPKVLRAAGGAHFQIPIITDVTWTDIGDQLPNQAHVYLVDNRKPSDKILDELAGTVDVIDHLNELEQKEGLESDDDKSDDDDESDSDSDSDADELSDYGETADDKFSDDHSRSALELYRKAPLPVQSYDEVDYVREHTVIVLGRDRNGVSMHARKLAYQHYGTCVVVPNMSDTDSLNCSISGSVVMYEANKQFRQQMLEAQERHEKENHDQQVDKMST